MKIVCTRKKDSFKNLTINKEYDNVIDNGETFTIPANDAAIRATYAKTYFRVAPEVPPTPVMRPLASMVTVEVDDDDITITLNRTRRTVSMNCDRTEVSCGVSEITGISSLKSIIRELIAAKARDIDGTETELFTIIWNTYMAWLRENIPAMCYIMSDNVGRTTEESMNTIIDSTAEYTKTGLNPNSGNQITLWVFAGSNTTE